MQESLNNFELQIKEEKLNILFKQSFPAIFISVANAVLLLIILWNQIEHSILISWFAVILFASLVRSVLFLSYKRKSPAGIDILNFEKPYFLSLTFSSLVWGLGCLWLISSTSTEFQLIIYFFLMGMAGGAISVYSSIRALVLTSVIFVLLPSTIWFLVFGDQPQFYTGIGSSLFLLSSIRSTKVLSSALHNSFLLSYELQQAKEQAEILSRTDFLTGLNNRNAFNELVEIQIQYCKRNQFPASMIVLDVDHFKNINDSKGHIVGDFALKYLASIMKKSVRISDICGRMGGEEFTIFLPGTDMDSALTVAEKIRKAIETSTIELDDSSFNMTASLGVFTGNEELETMIKNADKAMYNAKQSGRNRVCTYDKLVNKETLIS